ncbi:hypothetical protein AB0C69_14985 [Actinomadura sp. NPDC048032]|uniref:hypothetical protein n=1 Tax=Actinomadura sp. NPDC048032 TaxID=3155747 RepID=UPI003407559A
MAPGATISPTEPLTSDDVLSGISARFHRYADRALRDSPGEAASGPALLKRLADDLDPAGGPPPTGVDLVAAYPADALLPDPAPRRWLETTLFWGRFFQNVLVFAPIVVTWWKLHDALNAYGRAHSEGSFLLGWQAGSFDPDHIRRGVQDFAPLSETAWWVVLTVLVVIAFTALVTTCENLLDRPRYEAERVQIAQDVALASHLLSGSRDGQVTYRDLQSLVQRMETSVGGLIGRLAGTAEDVRAALEGSTGKRIEDAVQTWIDKAESLERAITAMQAPAETLERFRKLQDDIAAGQRELRAELAAMVTQVERATLATTDHAEAAQHYQDAGNAVLADAVARLSAGTDRLSKALEQLEYLVDDTREFVAYVRHDGGAHR